MEQLHISPSPIAAFALALPKPWTVFRGRELRSCGSGLLSPCSRQSSSHRERMGWSLQLKLRSALALVRVVGPGPPARTR